MGNHDRRIRCGKLTETNEIKNCHVPYDVLHLNEMVLMALCLV